MIEINLIKRQWFLNASYNPNKNLISHHFDYLNRTLNEYYSKYENFIFIDDFNVNVNDSSIKDFCSLNRLKSLINEPT